MHSLEKFEGDEQNKKEWTEREIGWRDEFLNKISKRKIIKG